MKIKNTSNADSVYKKFIFLLLFMFSLIVISIICLMIIADGQNQYLFRTIFIIMITVLFGVGILLLGIILNVMLLRYEYPVPKISRGLLRLSLKIAYPGLLFLNKLLGYDKDFIRKIFKDPAFDKIISIDYPYQFIVIMTMLLITGFFIYFVGDRLTKNKTID